MSISIYFASRFRDKIFGRGIREKIQAEGFGCTSRWLDEEPALDAEVSEETKMRVAKMDLYDMRRAQVVLLWNPAGSETYGTGGCHWESGAAVATEVKLVLWGVKSNVFHSLPAVTHFPQETSIEAILRHVKVMVLDFGPTRDYAL